MNHFGKQSINDPQKDQKPAEKPKKQSLNLNIPSNNLNQPSKSKNTKAFPVEPLDASITNQAIHSKVPPSKNFKNNLANEMKDHNSSTNFLKTNISSNSIPYSKTYRNNSKIQVEANFNKSHKDLLQKVQLTNPDVKNPIQAKIGSKLENVTIQKNPTFKNRLTLEKTTNKPKPIIRPKISAQTINKVSTKSQDSKKQVNTQALDLLIKNKLKKEFLKASSNYPFEQMNRYSKNEGDSSDNFPAPKENSKISMQIGGLIGSDYSQERDPAYIDSDINSFNDPSINYNSHFEIEKKGQNLDGKGKEVNSQKMILNNWKEKNEHIFAEYGSNNVRKKKEETKFALTPSMLERKMIDSNSPSQKDNKITKNVEDIKRDLRAKSPQFDAYRAQQNKKMKDVNNQTDVSLLEDEKIEVKNEMSKKEIDQNFSSPKNLQSCDSSKIKVSNNEGKADLEEKDQEVNLYQNLNNQKTGEELKKVQEIGDLVSDKQANSKINEIIENQRQFSIQKSRTNYEKFVNQNLIVVKKDRFEIPIIPSKYKTHSPRFLNTSSPQVTETENKLNEKPGSQIIETSTILDKKKLTDSKNQKTKPSFPYLDNDKIETSSKELILNEKDSKIQSQETNSHESPIVKLETDARIFPKFDKATVMVKEYGKIVAFAANTHKGKVRKYNEDRVSILLNAHKRFKKLDKEHSNSGVSNSAIFSIFDGHGGNSCCHFLKDNLHNAILEELDIEGLLISSVKPIYQKLDQQYQDLNNGPEHSISGSCAITAIIMDESIIIFNVGDSRAIMLKNDGKEICELTTDHKPDKLSEFNRIIENGGELYKVSSDLELFKNKFHFVKTYKEFKNIVELEKKNPRIVFGPWRVKPGSLSVSRSFGDVESKMAEYGGLPGIIISEPEVFDYDISEVDFLLLGCFLISGWSFR